MGHAIFAFIKNLRGFLLVAFCWLCFCHFAVAQGRYYSWDFSNCEIKDILYAMSLDSGISIVTDDTVSGSGDLKFAGKDFDAAFETFLNANRLFVKRGEGIWTVSKFSMKNEDGLFFVAACDMQPHQILEKLSYELKAVLTFDSLPGQKISFRFNGISEDLLMEALAKRFGNYEVLKSEAGYHFSKKIETRKNEAVDGYCRIERAGEGFVVDVRDCKFSDVIERLFSLAGTGSLPKNFCLLSGGDARLQRSVFEGIDFTDTLAKLCGQAGCAFVLDKDIFYIFLNGNSKNELITGNRVWKKFSLKFTKSQEFFSFLNKKIGKLETIALPDESSFLCLASKSEEAEILELIGDVDLNQKTYLVNLKYLKPSEFINYLPPGIDKSALFVADESSNLYFKGTESAYKNLLEQLEICDRPVKRLSYDLLILQYDETSQKNWSSSLSADRMSLGDRNSLSATLGSVMNFNMNVVTAFGLDFALDLQNSIEENKTKVFADTTLHGISGKKINFQNTNTYRYRDNNVDPDTGLPIYSGVTKEISSGIKLDILGWVSGDGMITSTVTASVSRQGTDTSASTGNPPPTSEKVITTEVRGKSGEPVILSGLVQKADSKQEKRTPFLSKIPLLGNLFKAKETTKEYSQMVIYLVPHLEDGDVVEAALHDQEWAERRMRGFAEVLGVDVSEEF